MINPYPADDDSEYIEDIPTLSAELKAQIQAKITDGTYSPEHITCSLEPNGTFSQWQNRNAD
jgi:hypothetical protein